LKKILITGGSKGIGFNTLKSLLDLNLEIISLSRTIPNDIKPHPKIKYVKGDITEISSLQKDLWGATSVLHIAGLTHSFNIRKYYEVNAEGTSNLIQRAETSNVKRFIYVSTQAIGVKGGAYSHSKEIAEKNLIESSLKWTILRPSEIYGLRLEDSIESLCRLIRSTRVLPIIGDGQYTLNPLHIEDFTSFTTKLQTCDSAKSYNKIYQLGGPCPISFKAFCKKHSKFHNHKQTIIHLPVFFCKLILHLCSKANLSSITPDQIDRLRMIKNNDISLAASDYFFSPREFSHSLNLSA
jgi:NADH dehydrogenase